ncbi:MAG: YtxH domain-containing protein [Prochlorotrichaceae cyanobacterium]
MADKQGKGSSGAWAGFLLGAALGSLGTLLVAPRSGRETRQQLRMALQDLSQITESLTVDFQVQAERLSDQALQQWEDTLTRLREAIAAGIEASQEEARNQQRRSMNRNTITVPAEPSTADSFDAAPAVEPPARDQEQGGSI